MMADQNPDEPADDVDEDAVQIYRQADGKFSIVILLKNLDQFSAGKLKQLADEVLLNGHVRPSGPPGR